MAVPAVRPGTTSLISCSLVPLDGYVDDADDGFGRAAPDEDVHLAVNEVLRDVGTFLHGRRTYEVMTPWDDDPTLAASSPATAGFAELWRSADKVVFPTTLTGTTTSRTRLERTFDPAAVQRLKDTADRDLAVGGPGLGGAALRAGLVDELVLFVVPVVVGGGTALFPDGVRLDLELVDQHRFEGGTVLLRCRVRTAR